MSRHISCNRACGVGCIGAIALAGMAVLALNSFLSGLCNNEVLSEIPSPDRTLKAVIFQRHCGAVVENHTDVSILPIGVRLPDTYSNLFVLRGFGSVKVAWTARRTLTITHDPRYYVRTAEDHVQVETGDGHKVPVSIHYTSEIRY